MFKTIGIGGLLSATTLFATSSFAHYQNDYLYGYSPAKRIYSHPQGERAKIYRWLPQQRYIVVRPYSYDLWVPVRPHRHWYR